MSKAEIILPFLFNTYEKPNNPNNYSVYIPRSKTGKCQIYINKKWFTFAVTNIDDDKKDEEDEEVEEKFTESKEVSDKEYNLIKAIREYMKED